jgi:hypothetical protein
MSAAFQPSASWRPKALLGLAGCLAALLAGAAPAQAARAQMTMMEDPTQLLTDDAALRARTLTEFEALGVDTLKIAIPWRSVAPDPDDEDRPGNFDAVNPGAYSKGAFARFDAAIEDASARGFRVLLSPTAPAPEWATQRGEHSGVVGVWRVDPAEFGRFVEALGRRYSGSFEGLPRVSAYTIWNEPNHPLFLQPLSEPLGGRRMLPSSPHRYRRMYLAAQAALERSGHGADTILFGEILPIGMSRRGPTNTVRPIEFLREFFCLNQRYRPYRGRRARVRGCSRFQPIRTSGLAYHAYTRPGGPRVVVPTRDDATIGQIRRLEQALNRMARTRRVRRGLPIWNTEFGLQSRPPDCGGFGTSLSNQAAYINEAEYISYTRPRVASYSNYLLIDDRINTSFGRRNPQRYRGFQSGLRFGPNAFSCSGGGVFAAGRPKPAYDAFRTPIFVHRVRGGVQVFGRARPRRLEPQPIEVLHNGRVAGTVNATGYFLVRVRGSSGGTWQLRWTHNGQTFRSRTTRALADPRARRRGSRGPERTAIGR